MKQLESNQYGLSLHTNTPQLGLTTNNFAGDYRSQILDLGRDISSLLHQYLIDFISPQIWSNISFLAVAKGPGGFTGTRIGIVTARTISQQLNIPVYPISNLAAIAHFSLNQSLINKDNLNPLLAVEMKAVRGQIFGGIYQADLKKSSIKTYLEDKAYTPEEWTEILNKLPQNYQRILSPENLAHTGNNMLELAYLQWQQGKFYNWSECIPFYGQHPVQ